MNYELFGLDLDASEDDIKRAYKRLVKKYHPDVCKDPNAAKKFIEIQKAYKELIEPDLMTIIQMFKYERAKRKKY